MFKMCQLENGKMTVEASFLLPIVFFILILILYFFFYCYEDGISAGILREEVEKASDVIKTGGNIDTGEYDIETMNKRSLTYLLAPDNASLEKQCCSNIKNRISKLSMFGINIKVVVQIKNGEIEGRIASDLKIPVIGSVQIGGISFFHIDQQVTKDIRMPAEQIRRWQQIE